MALLPAVAMALGIPVLAGLHWRDRQSNRRTRGAFFADCLDLFESCRVTQEGLAFPLLHGRYRGVEVRLEPVVDTMAWRKLPSLWLKATVLEPQPYRGVIDFLARPRGAEFYSPSGDLEHRMAVPAGWPQDAILCTDDSSALPPFAALDPAIRLFDEPHMKELVVTARGIRLVRQIWQAQRAHYLVLRQVVFEQHRMDPAVLATLLDAAWATHRNLASPMRLPEAA